MFVMRWLWATTTTSSGSNNDYGLMALLMAAPVESKLFFVAVVSWPTDESKAPIMRASKTAYSTAVGPSSSIRNIRNLFAIAWNMIISLNQ